MAPKTSQPIQPAQTGAKAKVKAAAKEEVKKDKVAKA